MAPDRLTLDGPLIFLAGPIYWGTHDWHERAAAMLHSLDARVHVASPRRDPEASAKLWNRSEDAGAGRAANDAAYDEQVDWETEHLRRAAAHGCVLFWLAREQVHNCERPHAQTTRFELAEWKERAARDGIALVVGIEDGFTGARYIRRRFALDALCVPICDSLEVPCRAAVAARALPRAALVAAE
jgi:hypothetical protein